MLGKGVESIGNLQTLGNDKKHYAQVRLITRKDAWESIGKRRRH